MVFSTQLKKLRTERQLSQDALAEQLFISYLTSINIKI